jgi:hypothetical protein
MKLLSSKFAIVLIGIWLLVFCGYTQAIGTDWKIFGASEEGIYYILFPFSPTKQNGNTFPPIQ